MIRQGFRAPDRAQGARLPTHTWRLSDPKMYVSARDMYGAKADVGKMIAGSLHGIGNNIRTDRIRSEQQQRADAIRAAQNARADRIRAEQNARQDQRYALEQERRAAADDRANQRFEWDKKRYQDSRSDRAEDREWKKEDRTLARSTQELRNKSAQAQLNERQVKLGIAQADRQIKLADRFRQRAASVKNPNEWNQLIDYFAKLGYTGAEQYRDFNS